MLSGVAPSLHIFILIGPLSWYRYFSVGKKNYTDGCKLPLATCGNHGGRRH